jgi:hypothetical protein
MEDKEQAYTVALSILITVVSGKASVRRCLQALWPQVDKGDAEVIVPYDRWSITVGDLAEEFPDVRFHFIADPGAASSESRKPRIHWLFDRRRAVGLGLARGRLIAMTEDHVIPAPDWCREIINAHKQPYAVVGGAIENGVDRPLNWALYYCDFGRYGRPRQSQESAYVSDVNVAYKRGAIASVHSLWRQVYHETTVHWALRERGEKLYYDQRLVVYQYRPAPALKQAFRERIEWGRVFAETRVADCGMWRRVLYALGSPALPALLSARVLLHMLRQRRSFSQMAASLPLALCLLTGWALGELAGYLLGQPSEEAALNVTLPQARRAEEP